MRLCAGIKPDGTRCRKFAANDAGEYCSVHDPARAEQRKEAASYAASFKGAKSQALAEIATAKKKLIRLYDEVDNRKKDRRDANTMANIVRSYAALITEETRIRRHEEIDLVEVQQLRVEMEEMRQMLRHQKAIRRGA